MSQLVHDCEVESFWELVHGRIVPFFYFPADREWGIAHIDTDVVPEDWWHAPKIYVSKHCPWCGVEFPPSLRAERRRRLAEIYLTPETAGIPEEYNTDRWWREAGL